MSSMEQQSKRNTWFWQRIVSPHMIGLAVALARLDCKVTYVAEQLMSEGRATQGWSVPDYEGIELHLVSNKVEVKELAASATTNVVHICQGIRGNGLVGVAQKALSVLGARQLVVMESVDDFGWAGIIKRLEYTRILRTWRTRIEGVLATGWQTPSWLADRGLDARKIFPFAYFLSTFEEGPSQVHDELSRNFRFVFVGQFIERKRLDLMFDALAEIQEQCVEISVIGSGPLEEQLRARGEKLLGERLNWIGRLPIAKVFAYLTQSDCLVLPSRYDGWGAVVCESLMAGTPVICSDGCGAANVVGASGHGGVFDGDSTGSLVSELHKVIGRGKISRSERHALTCWSRCLGAEAGAEYLCENLHSLENTGQKVRAPSPCVRIDVAPFFHQANMTGGGK